MKTTEQMQNELKPIGFALRRRHYAKTNTRGYLTDGYRWEIYNYENRSVIVTAKTPAAAYSVFMKKGLNAQTSWEKVT